MANERTDSSSPLQTQHPTPPAAALEHADDEGNTPAAWTACGGVILASLIGGLAVVFESLVLGIVAAAVAVVALIAGGLMSRAAASRRTGAAAGQDHSATGADA